MNFYIINRDGSTDEYIERLKKAGAAGEIDLGKIYIRDKDGIDFFAKLLINSSAKDLATEDQLIPSHNAPHVLAQVIIKALEMRGFKQKMIAFPEMIGTPYEEDLKDGLKALSFTKKRCVDDCIEPEICPIDNVKLEWDIGTVLGKYSEHHGFHFIGFECAHLVRKVAAIPMNEIVRGWLDIEKIVSRQGDSVFLIATHSKCHGIAVLIMEGVKSCV